MWSLSYCCQCGLKEPTQDWAEKGTAEMLLFDALSAENFQEIPFLFKYVKRTDRSDKG